MPITKQLVLELSKRIDEVVRPLLPASGRCALLDFPNHNNVGDNAIWAGEKAFLRRTGMHVVYQCDLHTYSKARLSKAITQEGVILLHGGGNLGDVWPEHQEFRERVLRDFATTRVIQLPQTIHFANPGGIAETRRAFRAHTDFVVLTRDHRSQAIATNELDCQALVCPDMAFALGFLGRIARPKEDFVWLARTDHEALRGTDEVSAGFQPVDWLGGEPGRPHSRYVLAATGRARRYLSSGFSRSAALRDLVGEPMSIAFDLLADRRVSRGRRILSRGRVVITDRLHGHILCLLQGIPHVVIDNNYGKLQAFIDTFTRSSPLVSISSSAAEAPDIASRLLHESVAA